MVLANERSYHMLKQESSVLYPVLSCFSYLTTTINKCIWAYHIYHAWSMNHNRRPLGDPSLWHVPDLPELSMDDLNFALSRFILEIREQSGENYPAETLYEIVVCLQLYMVTKGKNVKVLDEVHCVDVRNTLDSCMKELSYGLR